MADTTPVSVHLFFQAHQPYRLREYDFFQIGNSDSYFDEFTNAEILSRVCDKSYLPAIQLFKKLSQKTDERFKVSLGLSGTLLEQLEDHRPDVLKGFQELVESGIAELVGGTYHHSLASIFSSQEFARQIQLHRKALHKYFGKQAEVFANTELLYRDDLAELLGANGFKGVLAEGVPHLLGQRSPDFVYKPSSIGNVSLLLRNGGLSDDVGFRFNDTNWSEYPLTAEKFLNWMEVSNGPLRNIFLDLETIGEHQPEHSGIFQFWEHFILQAVEKKMNFLHGSEVITQFPKVDSYSCPHHSSWADAEKDKSPWVGGIIQQESVQKLFRLQQWVMASDDRDLISKWGCLQTADHFLHMSTKGGEAGAVHAYFSPYEDPYMAYTYFMNILADVQIRARHALVQNFASGAVVPPLAQQM